MVLLSLIIVNLVFALVLFLYNKLTCGYCKCTKKITGKVVIVTGGNAGIGYETAKNMAERGAKVIMACRSEQRGTTAKDRIVAETGNQDVHYRCLDLASFKSVRAFASEILKTEKRLDILINNAGMYDADNVITEDGLVLGMQVNHFGPFLLTCLLLPLLKKSQPSRIVNVSSMIHSRAKLTLEDLNLDEQSAKTFGVNNSYVISKLCNVLMTVELARRLKDTGVTTNSLHPGAVYTEILANAPIVKTVRPILKPFFKTPWQGAQTTIYLAVSPEVDDVSGQYYSDCHQKRPSPLAKDAELTRKLWEVSEELVKLK